MIDCPNCKSKRNTSGLVVVNNRIFVDCFNCGYREEYKSTLMITCPNCKHDVIYVNDRCPNCGHIDGEEVIIPKQAGVSSGSGTEIFHSGAVRANDNTPPYTLIPPCALKRLAKIYHEGAIRYGQINYQRGIPVSNILNHAYEHLNKWLDGDRTADHLAKVAWAMFTLIYFEETGKLEDDTIWTRSGV